MNSTRALLSASSVAKMKLMAADYELSQALVKVCITAVLLLSCKCRPECICLCSFFSTKWMVVLKSTWWHIAAVDGWCNCIHQMVAMCPLMRAHWRHLANTIELMHPLAQLSPQPEQQIDQFSGFCAGHHRKSLYFTMGNTIHQNCPFPWGIWIPSDTWFHWSPQAKRHLDCSVIFAQMTAEYPYTLQWFSRCPFP